MSALVDKVPLVAGAIKTIEEVASLCAYIIICIYISTYIHTTSVCVCVCVSVCLFVCVYIY
jgi:hypothetical protein